MRPLTIAVPKGRILDDLAPLFGSVGVDLGVFRESRKLVVDLPTGQRLLLLRPSDVPTYVEYGVADMAVCGSDTLLESGADVVEPLDLEVGRCRLSIAAPAPTPGHDALAGPWIRVATKYPNLTRAHFRGRGVEATIIHLYGSVELAAVAGLSDVVVDLVSTGATLRENGLVELETLREISSRLVVNRASLKARHGEVRTLVDALADAVASARAARAPRAAA
jgi:ATP phosphoribosyltransferase